MMLDRAPKEAVGYVAVHLPRLGAWQGFHVSTAHAARGGALLLDAGGVTRDPRGRIGIAEESPGTAKGDQPAVGALSALVARLLAIGATEPGRIPKPALEQTVGDAVYALYLAAGWPWLLVTGTPDAGGGSGMLTEVSRIEAGSLDEARERMLGEITREGQMRDLGAAMGRGLRDVDRGRRS